jgi:hypothetical protein
MPSPYRSFIEPVLKQVDRIKKELPGRTVAVLIPELIVKHWWQAVLHTRRAQSLRNTLREHGDNRVVVIDVPWFIED